MSDWIFKPNSTSEFQHEFITDNDASIKQIAGECWQNAVDHGFNLSIKNDQMVAMVDEIGEWCAALRSGDEANEQEEVIDMLVRIMAYAEQHFPDTWLKALVSKMEYNRGRPYKHGKNF